MIDAFLNNPVLFFGTLGIGGAALVYAAYRFLGWRGALAVLAAIGAAGALRNARKGGYVAGTTAETKRQDNIAIENLDKARAARDRARVEFQEGIQDYDPPPPDAPSAPEPASRTRGRKLPDDRYDRKRS